MTKGAKAVALTLGAGATASTYWLQYDIDKMAMLEELLDLDIDEIVAMIGKNKRVGFLRAILWAGLAEHQPSISLKAAGELLLLPGREEIGAKIAEAFTKAFPEPEAADNPPQAPSA